MHHVPHPRHRVEHYLQHRSTSERLQALSAELRPEYARSKRGAPPPVDLQPLTFDERSANELRPANFSQMVGQRRVKTLLQRIVANVRQSGVPLDHMLLVGASGTGKTTTAQVVAHELGRRVFMLKAPVDFATFEGLRRACQDGDVVIVDEIHQQCSGDRRGITQAADPETFFSVMEDHRLATPTGVVPFPAVTFIGATTDEGLLPEPFLNRFPLRPRLDPYTTEDMATLTVASARQLGLGISADAAAIFALASRRNPRQLNTYVRNARQLGASYVDSAVAQEVVRDLNGATWDGLTIDMQNMLRCLLRSRRESRGSVIYQASVNTIATQIGKSRDSKAVSLYVEPFLIEEGFVMVTHGGRQLTAKGIDRARVLS